MEIKSFILNKTEKLDKLSCHSHDPETLYILKKIRNEGIKLKDLIEGNIISGPMGFQLHTYDYVPESYPNCVKLLQISNISKLGELIDTQRDKFISKEKDTELKKSSVRKGDIIISKTGELGRIALFKEDYDANLNQALGIIRLKERYGGIKIIPDFINLFLNSNYANLQFQYFGGYRAGQSGLSLDEIKGVYILLPDEKKQKEILKGIGKIRNEAIQHYKKYISYANECKKKPLEILKIDIPDEKTKTFVFNRKVKDRIDSINNSPFLDILQNNIRSYGYKPLKHFLKKANNKFTYSNFYNIIDLNNINENLGTIKGWNEVAKLNSSKTTFKKDNILISKLGGERGNILLMGGKFDGYLGSGELVPFELNKNINKIYLKYLFYLLRSPYISKQIEYSLSGCSRMRINGGDMENLLIPLNNINKVNKVVEACEKLRGLAIYEKEQYSLKMGEVSKNFVHFFGIM